MIISITKSDPEEIKARLNYETFKQVKENFYLRIIADTNGKCAKEVMRKVRMAKTAF